MNKKAALLINISQRHCADLHVCDDEECVIITNPISGFL